MTVRTLASRVGLLLAAVFGVAHCRTTVAGDWYWVEVEAMAGSESPGDAVSFYDEGSEPIGCAATASHSGCFADLDGSLNEFSGALENVFVASASPSGPIGGASTQTELGGRGHKLRSGYNPNNPDPQEIITAITAHIEWEASGDAANYHYHSYIGYGFTYVSDPDDPSNGIPIFGITLDEYSDTVYVNRPGTANDEEYEVDRYSSDSITESCTLAEAGIDLEDGGYIRVDYYFWVDSGVTAYYPNDPDAAGGAYTLWNATFGKAIIVTDP